MFQLYFNPDNKCQSKMSTKKQNQYLDCLIDPSSQGASRLFVLPLENEAQQISYKRHYLLTVEMKNWNFMID